MSMVQSRRASNGEDDSYYDDGKRPKYFIDDRSPSELNDGYRFNGEGDSYCFVPGASPALVRPKRYYVDNRKRVTSCDCSVCRKGRRRDRALNPYTFIVAVTVAIGLLVYAVVNL